MWQHRRGLIWVQQSWVAFVELYHTTAEFEPPEPLQVSLSAIHPVEWLGMQRASNCPWRLPHPHPFDSCPVAQWTLGKGLETYQDWQVRELEGEHHPVGAASKWRGKWPENTKNRTKMYLRWLNKTRWLPQLGDYAAKGEAWECNVVEQEFIGFLAEGCILNVRDWTNRYKPKAIIGSFLTSSCSDRLFSTCL